ncbi:hypothetical protein K493DRAFT_364890 [Basidiobolus meristosporus CBS 931.73]|uniref:factor independent urate hydroxylase n=1 Tax=Basidiobolus meristosporus CBS 931.73 TaxID=1314790 RepID=A0A1Y1VTA4_9FUNG|nr:hypothetical protein K493DRAFT_364890 [Basidiobolus meristosporus CBS 931.73]|eukprot:ORX64532.1 hypothetical protein K493DRAFT_364890 [Basidiobolus meristosporus CBS 931.73]
MANSTLTPSSVMAMRPDVSKLLSLVVARMYIFSTSADAKWTYSPEKSKIQEIPFDDVANSVREITLSTFATDNSASV